MEGLDSLLRSPTARTGYSPRAHRLHSRPEQRPEYGNIQPSGAPPTYPSRVLGPWTPVTTSSSVANGPVVATNEAPGSTETGSPVEMDGTRERMPQVLGNLIYSTDRIWLWACSGRACAGVWWPVTRWRAVSRSCTFFLQTAISKRRDHAGLPGKPGHGNRMNVQQRLSCTFILSPDTPQGGKTLEPRHRPHQDPRMNVQHGPTPPAGTTTSRPAATTPAPTRPARYLNPEANTCAPTPTGRHNQQIPRQGSRPRRPTSDPTPTNRPLALITPQEAAS